MSGNSKRRLLDEVVDDSEPEREAKRQKIREQAHLARKKKCASLHPQQSDRLDQDIIELTDTECEPHDQMSATPGAQSQVDKSVIGEPVVPVSQVRRAVALTPSQLPAVVC